MKRRRVKAKHVALNGTRIAVVTDKGAVIERDESMPVGEWGDVPLPSEPAPKKRRRKR